MIYVHVPFCRSFCTYCDFYSERACPTQRWLDEVCAEARARKDEIAAAAAVDTLYFGGGTPSVLPLEFIGRIADACGGRSYREWTVEVNPDDITPEYAAGLRALGVNRVSMGVQSLDDGMLRWMNRRHDSDGARRAFRQLREAGFDNVSVDVIIGVGGMDSRMLEATVRRILDWRPEHISAYQLSVEEGSALGRMAREGRYSELPDEECSAQYYLVCRLLAEAGYEHYEISNWALPGRRAVHNSAYWTRAPYVGLGPGAHSLGLMDSRPETGTAQTPGQAAKTAETASDVPAAASSPAGCRSAANRRSWNSEALSGWTVSREVLSEAEIREEQIMLGLRTADGVRAELLQGSRDGLVPAAEPGCLRIPEERWFVADDIISGLI
ncbi:MAG: coproporphyrinogen III oxidase family protein [Bacteroidales bacterium]|nr:coproporphyrinogen III oxidase family protein [Bacteroidales bacterium]